MGRPHRSPRPTLVAVAELAGVSPSTVSRVVRGSPKVRPEVVTIVREAIDTLGYVPDLAARQLVAGRSDTVGLAIAEDQTHVFGDPFFGALVSGVAAGLKTTNYRFVLMVATDAEDRTWLEHYVGSHRVDGLMLLAPQKGDPLTKAMLALGVPIVFMGRPFANRDAAWVDADNAGGVVQAIEHLYATGRRRIATITGIRSMRSGHDRYAGYQRGLAAVGLEEDPSLVVSSDYTLAGGEQAMRELLQRDVPIDAVFVASDLMAHGAMQALRAAKRRVPRDVAVIGFGDDPSVGLHAPLSTVAQPVDEMGRELARLVVAAIEGDRGTKRTLLPTRLIIRSTA